MTFVRATIGAGRQICLIPDISKPPRRAAQPFSIDVVLPGDVGALGPSHTGEEAMIDKLHRLLFEPRYPVRYVGRHRAPSTLPIISISVRRSRSAAA